jgi:hypothetical protein
MDPQIVIPRDVRGNALVRWMVDLGPNVAYITDEFGFAELVRTGITTRLVGFPRADIFRHQDLEDGAPPEWAQLTPWFG